MYVHADTSIYTLNKQTTKTAKRYMIHSSLAYRRFNQNINLSPQESCS